MAIKNCFIRGSVVRYVQMPTGAVDTQLLEDATRRGQSRPCGDWRTDVGLCADIYVLRLGGVFRS